MIKFAGTRDGKPLYGFGLSERNLELLKQDMPIAVDLDQMGGHGTVVIMYGKTETELYAMMTEMGLVKPGTQINEQKQIHEG